MRLWQLVVPSHKALAGAESLAVYLHRAAADAAAVEKDNFKNCKSGECVLKMTEGQMVDLRESELSTELAAAVRRVFARWSVLIFHVSSGHFTFLQLKIKTKVLSVPAASVTKVSSEGILQPAALTPNTH